MPSNRPLQSKSVFDLEQMFAESMADERVLNQLLEELSYRRVQRARQLKLRIAQHISQLRNSPPLFLRPKESKDSHRKSKAAMRTHTN